LRQLATEVAEKAVAVVVLDSEVPGAKAPAAGHPDRRMRLLHGPRPEVDHGQLSVLAVPGEDLAGLPGFEDQVVGLVVALTLLDRRYAVAEVGVHRAAERHSCDETAAADAVEHRVRSEEHTFELQSRSDLVCRLL